MATYPQNPVSYGQTSSDVTLLQNFLIGQGMSIPAGATGYFGDQTKAALSQWQASVGIPPSTPGYGTNWGPRSLEKASTVNSSKVPISSTVPKASDTGSSSQNNVSNPILTNSQQNLSVYNLPQESYTALVPQLVPGTPEYQAAMDKISTAYFDVMQQQMSATTQQQQQAAQYNWQTLKKYIETNLNVSLSNDALQAWDQLQTLGSQSAGQGIEGSGIQNEAIDDYLRKVRISDTTYRNEAQTKEESNQQNYYTKFAPPEQVKMFIASNPEKARLWGLIPSDGKTMPQRYAEMKAKYPNMSDAEIQTNLATMYDENGNYRSDLYQKYMTGSNVGANQGAQDTANITYDQYGNPIVIPVKPTDTGVLDINTAKQQYQALNTPLVSQSADYAARVKLGSIKPTVGASASGGADTTIFNKITPPAGTTTPPTTNPPATVQNPITVPGSMTTGTVPVPTAPTTPTKTTTPTNPMFMTDAEASGGAAGLAAYQKRVAGITKFTP